MAGAVIAVDYGRRRIGVAASDPLGITAQGVATLDGRDRPAALDALAALVAEREAERVLVGHPVNLDGTAGPMAREAEAFAVALRARLRVPVDLVDERLSSFAADQALREAGLSRRERAAREDRVAAALLLRAWLDARAREQDR
jgi:putative Holliday junction resolvase